MTNSVFQHIVFFIFATFSTGFLFGISLLEQNISFPANSFATASLTFAVSGLILNFYVLNFIISKLQIKLTLLIGVTLLELGLLFIQFPYIIELAYIACALVGVGNSIIYSTLFYLFPYFKSFGVLISLSFTISTILFYLSNISKYALYAINIVIMLSFICFNPSYPQVIFHQKIQLQSTLTTFMSLLIIFTCFSKNLLTVTYFNYSQNQIVFTLGLVFSIASFIPLFSLKLSFWLFPTVVVAAQILSLFLTEITVQIAFFLQNFAASGMINLGFIIASKDSSSSLIYFALLVSNFAGFLSFLEEKYVQLIYLICAVFTVVLGVVCIVLERRGQKE